MAMPVKLNSREETAQRVATDLYLRDTFSWSMQQADALRRRDFGSVDWENVIEEIEDVGRRDQNRWESNCARAIEHLLKIEYWESADASNLKHWAKEIDNFRRAMARTLRRNPGLKGLFSELFQQAWLDGRSDAVATLADYDVEAGANASERDLRRDWERVLPEECPYTLDEVAGCDPRREREPRYEWPPGVAKVLTLGRGVKHYAVKPTSRQARRRR